MARWKARVQFLLSVIERLFTARRNARCYWRVTDRRTDRQTDGRTDGIAIASTALAMRRAVKTVVL